MASTTSSQLRITRPPVTWFFWTIAPMENANVMRRNTPATKPPEEDKTIAMQEYGGTY